MKRKLSFIWLLLVAILFSVNTQAQITVGSKKTPEPYSILEVAGKGGLRLPQVTTVERDALAVQGKVLGDGLTIYNITTNCVEYWNNTRWISMCDTTTAPQQQVIDEFTATAGETTFTLTAVPSSLSKVKLFVNGVRIDNDAVTFSGTTVTYIPANNGAYAFTAGDNIIIDYLK